MAMPMLVALGEMQPDPGPHEKSGDTQSRGQRRAQGHCQSRPDKRRQRKVSARSRGAEVAQRENKERETQAVTDEAKEPRLK